MGHHPFALSLRTYAPVHVLSFANIHLSKWDWTWIESVMVWFALCNPFILKPIKPLKPFNPSNAIREQCQRDGLGPHWQQIHPLGARWTAIGHDPRSEPAKA